MTQQILTPIIKSKRGRHRSSPSIQCSVCMENDAIARYQKRPNGKIYLHYIHHDQPIGIRYQKNRKTGKKDKVNIYKTCYVGAVTAGLPMPDETPPIKTIPSPIQRPTPKLNIARKRKVNISTTTKTTTEKQNLRSIRRELQDILLRLKNMEGNDGKPFRRVAYTRKFK